MFFCFFEQTTSSAREWGVRVVRICRKETGIAIFNLKNGFEIDWGRRSAKFRLQIHAHSNHAQQEEVNCNIIWLVNSETHVLIQLYLPFCCFIIFYNLSHGPTAPVFAQNAPPPLHSTSLDSASFITSSSYFSKWGVLWDKWMKRNSTWYHGLEHSTAAESQEGHTWRALSTVQ